MTEKETREAFDSAIAGNLVYLEGSAPVVHHRAEREFGLDAESLHLCLEYSNKAQTKIDWPGTISNYLNANKDIIDPPTAAEKELEQALADERNPDQVKLF